MKALVYSLAAAAALAVTSSAFSQGRLVGIDGTGIYEISMVDGSTTLIGSVSGTGIIGELTYDWNNHVLYMISTQNQNLMTLDIETGNHTVLGTFGLGTNPIMHGLEYNPHTNRLYAHSGGSGHGFHLYELDTANGAASFIGTSGLTSFHNLGYNSHTGVMYMTNSNTDSLYTIDLATNQATLVGSLMNSTNPNSLTFNHHTGVMYMLDNSTDNLYTLNLETGEATVVGFMGASNFLSMVYIPIPGPGGLAVLALAGLVRSRRRR